MWKKENRVIWGVVSLLASGLSLDGCARDEVATEASTDWEGLNQHRAAAWGVYDLRRPTRSPEEVLARARTIAAVVLARDDLPDPGLLDPQEIEQWSTAAQADRYREAAYRFTWEGRDVAVRYRPASDRLTVIVKEPRGRPTVLRGLPDPGIGRDEALAHAGRCLQQLEAGGVIAAGEFRNKPIDESVTKSGLADVQGTVEAWIEQYAFVFTPALDGLPLLSAEVVVGVDARSGACRRITVGGQVDVRRLTDANVVLSDEAAARDLMAQKMLENAVGIDDALVRGQFGYYLPLAIEHAVVSPAYIGYGATTSGPEDAPALSRGDLFGLDLSNPEAALAELLAHE